jgi:hypothetical protein
MNPELETNDSKFPRRRALVENLAGVKEADDSLFAKRLRSL